MSKPRLAILGNETPGDIGPWISACRRSRTAVEFDVVDLTANDWIEKISEGSYDILLARPGGITARFKQLYDERIFILADIMNQKIFPSPLEIYLYENKRFLAYWLKANKIPCPATEVFYDAASATDYAEKGIYPFVAKTNIGASGSGVQIIRDHYEANRYISETFSGKGSPQRTGPNLGKGGILKRGIFYFFHPSLISKKLDLYRTRADNLQKGIVIFQEYIPHEFEWRMVRIGDSYFGHKKTVKNGMASGTLLKIYEDPPVALLDFVKDITTRYQLFSMAIDIFEYKNKYLVNEMQCFFGQSDPYQMLVGGIPGRYIFKENAWVFEPGDFAVNMCYDLRLETALGLI